MDFFNDLQASYSLLKKRKLHIRLDEGVVTGTAIQGYKNLQDRAAEQDPVAIKALERVDADIGAIQEAKKNKNLKQTLESMGFAFMAIATPAPAPGKDAKAPTDEPGEVKEPQGKYTIANPALAMEVGSIPAGQQTITIGTNNLAFNSGLESYKRWLSIFYYKTELGEGLGDASDPGAGNEDGKRLTGLPEFADLMGMDPDEFGDAGPKLAAAIAETLRLARELKDVTENPEGIPSLVWQHGSSKFSSLLGKVHNALFGKDSIEDRKGTKYPAVGSLEDAEAGRSVYVRPDIGEVMGSIESFNSVLALAKKLQDAPADVPLQDILSVLDNVATVTSRKKGKDQYRVFLKSSSLDSSLGLSFDWDVRDIQSPMQNLLETLQENINDWADSKGIDHEEVAIKNTERKASAGGVANIIGTISERMDTFIDLSRKGHKDSARSLFRGLYDRYHDEMINAMGITRVASEGDIVGTGHTEDMAASLQEVNDLFVGKQRDLDVADPKDPKGTLGVTAGSAEELRNIKEIFHSYVGSIFKGRAEDLNRRNPDFVAQVGGSVSGKKGQRVDQRFFYSSRGDAIKRNPGYPQGAIEETDLSILNGDERKRVQEEYGFSDEQMNGTYYCVNDSLKFTNDSLRTNLGSTASVLTIAREFMDPGNEWSNDLYEAMGIEGAGIEAQSGNFGQLEQDIAAINDIFSGKTESISLDGGEVAQNLVDSISDGQLSNLGITDTQRDEWATEARSANWDSEFMKSFKSRVEAAATMGRMQTGMQSEDEATSRSWRQTMALHTMRGCYDTSKSFSSVYNYQSGQLFRYNGNKQLLSKVNAFVEDGSNLRTSRGSFSIGGYTCSFDNSGEHNSLKATGPVDQSGLVKYSSKGTRVGADGQPLNWDAEGNPVDAKGNLIDSTQYTTTELMNKLLEVQQLMFSQLIKE